MRGNLLLGSLLTALTLTPNYSAAYDAERVKAHLSDDLVHCTVYYQFDALSAKEGNRKDIEAAAVTSKNYSLELLVALRPQKEEIPKIEADIDSSLKQFAGVIKKEGWSRLTLQYGDLCQKLLENPKARIQYWLDKRDR
jgi:ribosome-binding factor A